MLSYLIPLLPQHIPTWSRFPTPQVSRYRHPCIVGNSLQKCSITNILWITRNVDSYYEFICNNEMLMFESYDLLEQVTKKYKLSSKQYKDILHMCIITKPRIHSARILRNTVNWYPEIRDEYAVKHRDKIINLGYCFAFPNMDPGEIDVGRINYCIVSNRYDEAEYLVNKIDYDILSHIHIYNISNIPINLLKVIVDRNNTPSANYAIAHTLVYNKLPPNMDECIASSMNYFGFITDDLAVVSIRYNYPIDTSKIFKDWSITDNICKLLPKVLDDECRELCDKLIEYIGDNNVHLEDYIDNPILHYIDTRLAIQGKYSQITLDNCELCNNIRAEYTNY